MVAAKFRRLIPRVLIAGENFLVSGRGAGLAKASQCDGSEGRPRRGGRELNNRELRKMAEPGSLCLPCEPTLVVSRAACRPARGGRASQRPAVSMPSAHVLVPPCIRASCA